MLERCCRLRQDSRVAVDNPASVERVLDERRDHELLGTKEDDWLDFKSQPYVLKTPKQKWELAKDVAALANLPDGGCVVIGIKTLKDPYDFEDKADEVAPFPCTLLNVMTCREVIQKTVYPLIRGLRIRLFPREKGECLAIIIVPPQEQDDGRFLVNRVINEEGHPVTEAFAVPVRDGARTAWETVGQVHRDIADGRRSRREIPSLSDESVAEPVADVSSETLVDRATSLEAYMGWEEQPTLMLAAWPVRKIDRVPHLYDEGGIRGNFENPPQLRDAGFGIGWRAEARVEGGALVAADSHRIRWLNRDGSFFVAARADQEFLCRTSSRNMTPRPLLVNHVVLVEFTYVFDLFHHQVLAPVVPGPWRLGQVVLGARSRPWSMLLGPRANYAFHDEGRPPSEDIWVQTVASSVDPAFDAFALVARFYDLFGVGERDIPFAIGNRIDPEQLLSL